MVEGGMTVRAQISDTHPAVERLQVELFRKATPEQRVALALDWSNEVIELARAGIRRAHPGATDEEVDLLFVRVHYGDQLADRLAAFLRTRR
jgi:hypothetical protein